jgi:hypothetical protein
MNIDKLFLDKKYLEKEINFFITKKQIKKIEKRIAVIKRVMLKRMIGMNRRVM